jgi:hypothetical protein
VTIELRLTHGDESWPLLDDYNGVKLERQNLRGAAASRERPDLASGSLQLYFRDLEVGRQLVRDFNRLCGPGGPVAAYHDLGVGEPLYLELRVSEDDEWWRTELVPERRRGQAGQAEWHSDILMPHRLGANQGRVTLDFVRRNFWETSDERELALSNGSDTAELGGLELHNHNDAGVGDDNFADIAAGDVDGDLPTPARFVVRNVSGAGNTIGAFSLALNARYDPSGFVHILEAENNFGGTLGTAGTASGGEYVAFTWAGDTETSLESWGLNNAALASASGGYFRVLAFLHNTVAYTDLKLRVALWYNLTGTADMIAYPQQTVPASTKILDLGLVRLPPRRAVVDAEHILYLELKGQRTGGATVDLDFFQITPLDGWRRYEPLYNKLEEQETLTDDGALGRVYAINTATYAPSWTASGAPILLHPGVAQRLYWLAEEIITREIDLSVYYRPRKQFPL